MGTQACRVSGAALPSRCIGSRTRRSTPSPRICRDATPAPDSELSGGNPTQDIAGNGVRIENVTYVSGRDATDADIGIQGGPYGPVNWYIVATWLHQGETSPQWRSASWGDTTPAAHILSSPDS